MQTQIETIKARSLQQWQFVLKGQQGGVNICLDKSHPK
jgi:hypothetical protein